MNDDEEGKVEKEEILLGIIIWLWFHFGCKDFDTHFGPKIKESKLCQSFINDQGPH